MPTCRSLESVARGKFDESPVAPLGGDGGIARIPQELRLIGKPKRPMLDRRLVELARLPNPAKPGAVVNKLILR